MYKYIGVCDKITFFMIRFISEMTNQERPGVQSLPDIACSFKCSSEGVYESGEV